MARLRNPSVVYLEVIRGIRSADGSAIHKYEFIRHFVQFNPDTLVVCSKTVPSDDLLPAHRVDIDTSRSIVGLYAEYCHALLALARNRKIDVVYGRTSLYSLLGYLFFSKLKGIPFVCEVNGLSDDEYALSETCRERGQIGLASRLDRWLARTSEQHILGHADAVIAVTERLGDLVAARTPSTTRRIAVIENGANTGLFRPLDREAARRQIGMRADGPIVCFVGNFAPWQGIEHLIDAAPRIRERHPSVHFLLVGDGLMKEAWARRAAERGVDCAFTFSGRIPYEDVPAYIAAGNICVAPFTSSRNEKIGLSPLKMYEYLACARPVVASGLSGITELLERSGSGIAVPPDDPGALAEAIAALLADPERCRAMGENGCRYVHAHHSWASVAERTVGICREAAERNRRTT